MKKRILFVLTLLIAFFGFMGLSISNKQVDVYAAGDQNSVNSDLQVVLNNIPERAILSFPVTYESVYGNEISFSVQEVKENEITIIEYDRQAHWMVVNRPTLEDKQVEITVTVTGKNEVKLTDSKTITVPKGRTSTRSYSINYEVSDENVVGKNNPENPLSYKLGQKTIELYSPTTTNVNYFFSGWYDNPDFDGAPVTHIYVGSMSDINLYAKWEKVTVESIEVLTNPTKTEYNALESFDSTGIIVQANYNNGTTSIIDNGLLEFDKTILHFNDKIVTVTYADKTAIINITVNKIDFNMEGIKFEDSEKTYNGLPQHIEISGDLPEGVSVNYEGSATNVNETPKEIKAIFTIDEKYSLDYNVPQPMTADLTITKKTLTITPVTQTFCVGEIRGEDEWELDYDGFVNGEEEKIDEIIYTDLRQFSTSCNNESPAGNYDLFVAGIIDKSGNYNIEFKAGVIKLNDGEYELVLKEGYSLTHTYDKSNKVFEVQFTSNGVVKEVDLSYKYTNTENDFSGEINAGKYEVTVTYNSDTYGTGSQNFEFVINPAKLIVKPKEVNLKLGQQIPTTFELEYTSFYDGDNENNSLDGEFVVTTNATMESPAGTYDIIINNDNVTSSNYDIVIETGKLNINSGEYRILVDEDTLTTVYNKEGQIFSASLVDSETGETINGIQFNYEYNGQEYKSFTNAGTYENVKVYFEDNQYSADPIYVNYTIDKATIDMTGVTFNDNSVEYNGKEQKLEIVGSLPDGVSVSYQNNTLTNVGEVTATALFEITLDDKDNYNSIVSKQASFEVYELDLTDKEITIIVNGADWNLDDESSLKPGVTVSFEEYEITYDEPEYVYHENSETPCVGQATIIITFNGNFKGTASTNFEITQYGQAYEDAQELIKQIGTIDSTTAHGLQLPTSINDSTVVWSHQTTAVYIVNNVLYVNTDTSVDTPVKLTANVSYGDSSSYVQPFEFVIKGTKQKEDSDEDTEVIIEKVQDHLVFDADIVENADTEYAVVLEETEQVVVGYDITFYNNSTVVSNPGKVVVKLPIPEEYSSNPEQLTIYHIVSSNPYTKEEVQNVSVVDGYLVFEADSFSPYIIVAPKEEPQEEKAWVLVNDVNDLQVGDQIVIVAKDYDYALSTSQSTNNRGQASVTKNGNIITFGDDVQILTLQNGTITETFALDTQNGYLYAASSSKNYLRTETTLSANSSWSITITDNIATIVSQGTNTRNTMQYNQASSLFGCYASASQKALTIYKYGNYSSSNTEEEHKCILCEVCGKCTIDGCNDEICSCNEVGEVVETVTISEFLTKADDTNTWYQLTGIISNINDSTYGNFTLVDQNDSTISVYVYGLTSLKVSSNDKSFASLGLQEGYILTLIGTHATYNNNPQVGGPAYYVTHEVVESITPSNEVTYTFSNYAAGTQFASNEEHTLDSNTKVIVNDGHFTEQLRLYDSSSNNTTAIFSSAKTIQQIVINAGYKAATLEVYASTDGVEWNLISSLTTKTAYENHIVQLDSAAGYKYIKLDAVGAQVRVAFTTFTFTD